MNFLEKYKVIDIVGYKILDKETGEIIESHQYSDEEKAFFDSKMGSKEYEELLNKQSNNLAEGEEVK